ncbi:unnamed protein product, partial [Ectocarpus sp. 6 AP-2014]
NFRGPTFPPFLSLSLSRDRQTLGAARHFPPTPTVTPVFCFRHLAGGKRWQSAFFFLLRYTGHTIMRRLNCAVQNYAWGKRGKDSMVSKLKMMENEGFETEEDKTYAELWMGTHPNGPSRVMPEPGDFSEGAEEGHAGIFLIELLETHPHYLGDLQEQGDLPFMFKVLSINKALSIQAHPDKKLAERLYATRPDLYKDDNHKPEMAVALSDFEGLCGFRPFEEIVFNLHRYPELRGLVSLSAMRAMCSLPEDPEDQRDALRKLFQSYITAKPEVVATQVNALVQRLGERADDGGFMSDESLDHTDHEEIDMEDIYGADYEHREKGEMMLGRLRTEDYYVQDLMRRLSKEYPGDIGIMMPLLLNYLRMGEGESFFMAANEPHAYLKGDIMEVMARSDNVVRVALTPKHRDVPLLCEILTYNMGAPPIVTPIQVDQCCHRFTPPIKDFELDDMKVPEGGEYTPLAIPVPSICMVLEGVGSASDGVR